MSKEYADLKVMLESRFDIVDEVNSLLGAGKGHVFSRRCWNSAAHKNGDKTPSLTFNPAHGGWKCQACNETGDLYTLYMKVKGWTFSQTMKFLLEKYKLDHYTRVRREEGVSFGSDMFPWKPLANEHRQDFLANLTPDRWSDPWAQGESMSRLEFMWVRYGIRKDTIKRFLLAVSRRDARVQIPIPLMSDDGDRLEKSIAGSFQLPSLANVRKHDVFRKHCGGWIHQETKRDSPKRPPEVDLPIQMMNGWEPWWNAKSGKVTSISGHGGHYLYPINQLHMTPPGEWCYLLGGELKALGLLQEGIRAVSLTGGEGGITSKQLQALFMGRKVKVLMDPDERGVELGIKSAKILANIGCDVELGVWNVELQDKETQRELGWPEKGDVNDLIRKWTAGAINDPSFIIWKPVDRETPLFESDKQSSVLEIHAENRKAEVMDISFEGLTSPMVLKACVERGVNVSVDAIISGKGEVPFAVPKKALYKCKEGQRNYQPKCSGCGLADAGFQASVEFSIDEQVDCVAQPSADIDNRIRNRMRIPKGCRSPEIQRDSMVVEKVILCPSVRIGSRSPRELDRAEDSMYHHARRPAYMLFSDSPNLDENAEYQLEGRVLTDPRKSNYTFAVTGVKQSTSPIFNWKPSKELDDLLTPIVSRGVAALVEDIRDNVVQIFSSDTMILAQFLTWFLPFKFKIGPFSQERICPQVLIIGDTYTGKTTVYDRMMSHFGVGRKALGDSDPTTAGLIGGQTGSDTSKAFSWGLLPTSNRSIVGLDEWHKVREQTISSLAGLISSGIAERTIAGGTHKAQAWVRILAFANPKSGRPIASYSNPMTLVYEIQQKQENVGRVEFAVIHPKPPADLFSDPELGMKCVEHRYVSDLARYHLGWAWHLTNSKIHFEDPADINWRAANLATRYGSHDLLLPTAARFKLARVAAGFASIMFSHNEQYHLLVKKEHVDMAESFFHQIYDRYLLTKVGQKTAVPHGMLPQELLSFLNKIPHPHWKRLAALSKISQGQGISGQDLIGIFGGKEGMAMFLDIAQFGEALITQRGTNYYPTLPSFPEQMGNYVSARKIQEQDKVDAVSYVYDPSHGSDDLDPRVEES